MIQQLIGLVIAGGESSRMGTDKSILNYHGIQQRYYVYEQLQRFCEDVFICCNKLQATEIETKYNKIIDNEAFQNIGPAAAILTAHEIFPKASFLCIGCDYPYLIDEDIANLVKLYEQQNKSVVYKNEDDFIEPLIALFQLNTIIYLKQKIKQHNYSLRRFLATSNAIIIKHEHPERIKSIDTWAAYQAIVKTDS